MYNLTSDFQEFYDKHVRLGTERRSNLASKRDINLSRLKAGLDELSEETGRPHPYFKSWENQGGYAMHTLNQDPHGENGYDIDVGIIFNKADLPELPLAARQRVRDALLKKCGTFADVPEARTNAVTIWYSEGYHIDFAVYRSWTDERGTSQVEHASTTWKLRNPTAVTTWFSDQVETLSPKTTSYPGYTVKVKPGQFRRIVRYIKWFCRSRTGWSLPGGMIVSCLLADGVYRPDPDRDDRALYNTLVALRDKTANRPTIISPVDGSDLTAKTETQSQIKRLHRNLKKHIPKLDILFDQNNCTRQKARFAWDWIFNHEYWGAVEETGSEELVLEAAALAFPNQVKIRCDLSRKAYGKPYAQYRSGSSLLRKGIHLTFSVEDTDVVPPYDIEWTVSNKGDEAEEADELSWCKFNKVVYTSTKFKGRHSMTCKLKRNGKVLAESRHIVRVAAGPLGNRF